jgi:uncharacterized protein YgbK (DUF1537 family)
MINEGEKIAYTSIESKVPPEWKGEHLRQQIKDHLKLVNKKIIVLDDDPTGVQTVHDIDVLTQWDEELLREAFNKPDAVFYILTNTRGYEAAVAERINREIAHNVQKVATELGAMFVFVSRSDSTLRGYYPLEIDVLSSEKKQLTGKAYDGHLLIPAFFEGGRVTYENIHYIQEGETLVPVHETEFAQDKVFGYQHGNLAKWVEEKTAGRFKPEDCFVISLEQLRRGPEVVKQALLKVEGNKPVIVNCLSYADLDVLSMALLQAEEEGKSFVYRTGASFVKSYGGFEDRDYLPKEMLVAKGQEAHGGVIVVGSYVQKTTRQLEQLLRNTNIIALEMDVERIMNPAERESELSRLMNELNHQVAHGKTVALYSSRKLMAVENKAENLEISQTVSSALVQLVRSLQVTPRFIIAKGGITSSDVATKGLNIRKAKVLGQVAAGIPVWLTGNEAKFSEIPYIVFPGNVGGDHTLVEIVQKIHSKETL